jgi:hypothetical protein
VLVAATGCARRESIALPLWHTGATLDRDAEVTVLLNPRAGERFGSCTSVQMAFSDVESDIPEIEKDFSMAWGFTISSLDEVARVGKDDVELRSWTGPALMDFHMRALDDRADGTMELDFGFAPTTRRLSRQSAPFERPRQRDEVDEQRSSNSWQVNVSSSLYALEYPKGRIRSGHAWDDTQRVVKLSGDRALRDEMVAEQTWTFVGVEHARDGDYFHFTLEGELRQTTKSDLVDADFRADTRGVARIFAGDGEQAQFWYAVEGQVDSELGSEDEVAKMDAKVSAVAETTTALLGGKNFSLASSGKVHPGLVPCLERPPGPAPETDLRTASIER